MQFLPWWSNRWLLSFCLGYYEKVDQIQSLIKTLLKFWHRPRAPSHMYTKMRYFWLSCQLLKITSWSPTSLTCHSYMLKSQDHGNGVPWVWMALSFTFLPVFTLLGLMAGSFLFSSRVEDNIFFLYTLPTTMLTKFSHRKCSMWRNTVLKRDVLFAREQFWLRSFPGGASGKESSCQCRRHKRLRCSRCVGKIPWRRVWQPTPVFLLENSMDRGAWWATVHRVARSQTLLKRPNTHARNFDWVKNSHFS